MATDNTPRNPASYEHLIDHDHDSGRTLRLGLLAAAMIHLMVFAMSWPTLAQTEVVAPDRVVVRPVQPVIFVKPPPPAQRFTVPPRRVPIPDPDPQGPEPMTSSRPETVPIDIPDDVVRVFPDSPPFERPTVRKTVANAGIDVDPPRVLHRVQPLYTDAALRIRFEGAVVLSLLIDPDGRVADINVLSGLPFGLTENAVSAARQWLFEPCTFNGNPVSVRMILTVRFNIAS